MQLKEGQHTRIHSVRFNLYKAHKEANLKHDFTLGGNVTLEGNIREAFGVLIMHHYIWVVFTWICSFY